MIGMNKKVTFSFGKNWQNFLRFVDEERLEIAKESITEFLELNGLEGLSFEIRGMMV